MAEVTPHRHTDESSELLRHEGIQQGQVQEETREIHVDIPPSFSQTTDSRNWPTVDGSIGLNEQESLKYARTFFRAGFFLLPWLWAVNCFYFFPVLTKSPSSYPQIRRYVVGSAIGFVLFTTALCSWAFTFAIGGEHLFGPVWDRLVMYNVAGDLGLTAWN
ncbi:putative gamma-secretase subunit PEN-2 [Nymphaea thermarum]|nr:putative gamma-secretase subunit PEN-2 [Nymphaea thermarum]